MSARTLLLLASLPAILHFVMRTFGLGAHTSILAGMPQSDASYVVGPLYAMVWMAFVTLTPILALTAAAEALTKKRGRRGEAPTPAKDEEWKTLRGDRASRPFRSKARRLCDRRP